MEVVVQVSGTAYSLGTVCRAMVVCMLLVVVVLRRRRWSRLE